MAKSGDWECLLAPVAANGHIPELSLKLECWLAVLRSLTRPPPAVPFSPSSCSSSCRRAHSEPSSESVGVSAASLAASAAALRSGPCSRSTPSDRRLPSPEKKLRALLLEIESASWNLRPPANQCVALSLTEKPMARTKMREATRHLTSIEGDGFLLLLARTDQRSRPTI